MLDTYDSDIQHRKGSLHVNAGAESPDEDVIKKTANVSFNAVRSTKSGKNKKKTTKIGVTTNWLDQWSDDHVLKLQRSFLRAMIEIIQNEVNTLDPVYITNSEICRLWNLIGGIL